MVGLSLVCHYFNVMEYENIWEKKPAEEIKYSVCYHLLF